MRKLLLFFTVTTLLFFGQKSYAQDRYIDNIFTDVSVETDVVYGSNVTVFPTLLGLSPAVQDLVMDIYHPTGDTETNRPAVILLHTGVSCLL